MKRTIKHILTVALFTLFLTGVAAFGESRTPNSSALASPENVYLSHNQTTEDMTEYVLTWDKVKNADGYEITAFGKTFTTKKNSYDLTTYCTVGKNEKITVKAVSETEGFHDSENTSVIEKVEEVTNNLVYTVRGKTEYTASHENVDVDGRLVFPDAYDGKPITKIMKEPIKKQYDLTSVRFPKRLTVIGERTFSSSSLENVIIPEGVTTIEESAFQITNKLKNVAFPSTLVVIEEGAFGTSGIENLLLPSNVKTLGTCAFFNCDNLKTVSFEKGSKLTELGNEAFSCCANLEEITLPDSLQTIGAFAFEFCDKLTALHIPRGVTELKDAALFNKAFTAYTVAEENPAYKAIDGNVYSKDGTELVQYAVGKEATEFIVPDEVTKIGHRAFYLEEDLLSVSLPQGLIEIDDYAFSGCGITEIDLPYGLTTIGEGVFAYNDDRGSSGAAWGASNLTSIVVPDSVTSYGNEAFSTKQLSKLIFSKNIKVIKKGSLKTLRIPFLELGEGVVLEEYALSGAYIKQLIMPKEFMCEEGILGRSLFSPYIIDVLYKGTQAEWEALKEAGAFDENTFSTEVAGFSEETGQAWYPIYFYSEEEPPLSEDGTDYAGLYWHYAEDGITPIIWKL